MEKTITLPPQWAEWLKAEVAEGRFGTAEEAVAQGLALLRARQAETERLRAEIQAGLDAGLAEPLTLEELQAKARDYSAKKDGRLTG